MEKIEKMTLTYSVPEGNLPELTLVVPKQENLEPYKLLTRELLNLMEEQANLHPTYQEAIEKAASPMVREEMERQVEKIEARKLELVDKEEGEYPMEKKELSEILLKLVIPQQEN